MRPIAAVTLLLTLAGCGATGTGSTSSSTSRPATPAQHRAAGAPRHPPAREATSNGVVISHCSYRSGSGCPAPPSPDSCAYKGNLQDSGCTPGALNPDVTQDTIEQTICVSGYTSRIRPPVSYTEPLKYQLMNAYGVGGRPASGFELDHLIPLELGGAPADARNLWPEPHPGSYSKDGLENSLRGEVCGGQISLAAAQRQILDWSANRQSSGSSAPRSSSSSGGGGAAAPSTGFCSTHSCIASFSTGTGYIVQCSDGQWSHSGGRSGVCSGHGGVRR